MGTKVESWLTREGLALIAGWRRQGDGINDIAEKIGIGQEKLLEWRKEHEDIERALTIDRETANFMVEDALFQKSLAGDAKAYEFWLKHRMPEKWGKQSVTEGNEGGRADYFDLAQMINNPVARGGCGAHPAMTMGDTYDKK